MDGGAIGTTSDGSVPYSVGGLPPNTFVPASRLERRRPRRHRDKGFLDTGASGAVEFAVPRDSVFALTNTPIMSVPR